MGGSGSRCGGLRGSRGWIWGLGVIWGANVGLGGIWGQMWGAEGA